MSGGQAGGERRGGLLHDRRILIAAVLLGVLVRILMVLSTPVLPTVANTWDSNFYHEVAGSLARGEGYAYQDHPTAFFPPAFPFLVSLAYRVTAEDPLAGQAVNLLLSLGLAATTGWWVSMLAGRAAGRLALILMLLEPSQMIMPVFLMSETLCAAAIMLGFAGFTRWAGTRRAGWALLGAASMTLAGMTRGHAFLLIPVVFGVLHWRGRLAWKELGPVILLTALLVGGVLAGWTARNVSRLGHPVPVATNGGINLLLGNNPEARGGRADPPGGVPQTGDEVVDERLARERALNYIREHPGRFLLHMPVKMVRLWAFAPSSTYRHELQAKWGRIPALAVILWAQLMHVVVALLALRFVAARLRGPRGGAGLLAWWILTVAAIWSLGHLPFLGGARYLFPIQPLLIAAAACGPWILSRGGASPVPR